ncbi:MAG: HypC/HybG/HupF family hydrogenase formation chaperone [Desulfovibrionaceae bacterium]|nr:HypC/HybG/HupF family hydrogenase formation chaperone [Desulfovibrionaceae bacterium]MBF0513377.1 HypC/HybG/HupF family hydrogenase formation chaperone [Desulfovibrionaceae bacterium]
MCLAIPMEIKSIDGPVANVEISGVTKQVRLDLMSEEASVGDYVIVHAGFAISRLDREQALETLEIFKELRLDAF